MGKLLLVIGCVDLPDTGWNYPLYGGIHVTQMIAEVSISYAAYWMKKS